MPEALDTVYLHVIKSGTSSSGFAGTAPVPSRLVLSFLLSVQVGVSRLVGGLLNTYEVPPHHYSLTVVLYTTYIFSNAQINID